jgi:hypothetical protein
MRTRIPHAIVICATAVMCFFLSATAFAQYRTSIQGTVTDTTGAVIPGATLTLTNLSTNEKLVRTSSSDGVFNFNALPADHFALVVEKTGFQKKILNNLQLIPEQSNAVNVQMDAGAASTTITVDASQRPRTISGQLPTMRSSIFPSMSATRPASFAWLREFWPMERWRPAAADSRLRARKRERPRAAAETWGIQAVSSPRKMALLRAPTAANLKRTDTPSTASAR